MLNETFSVIFKHREEEAFIKKEGYAISSPSLFAQPDPVRFSEDPGLQVKSTVDGKMNESRVSNKINLLLLQ